MEHKKFDYVPIGGKSEVAGTECTSWHREDTRYWTSHCWSHMHAQYKGIREREKRLVNRAE